MKQIFTNEDVKTVLAAIARIMDEGTLRSARISVTPQRGGRFEVDYEVRFTMGLGMYMLQNGMQTKPGAESRPDAEA